MTAPTKTVPQPQIRHAEFCQPTGGRSEIRVESYDYLDDDPKSGRSRPTHRVTRCQECGEANYKQIGA